MGDLESRGPLCRATSFLLVLNAPGFSLRARVIMTSFDYVALIGISEGAVRVGGGLQLRKRR
jgi:hypothetical protein